LIREVFAISPQMATLPQLKLVSDHHTSPGQAGTVFVRARPKLAVYSHFILIGATAEEVVSRTRRTYQGTLEAGEDLMRFTIGSGVAVKKWDPGSSKVSWRREIKA
jgi:ribonuclease Z